MFFKMYTFLSNTLVRLKPSGAYWYQNLVPKFWFLLCNRCLESESRPCDQSATWSLPGRWCQWWSSLGEKIGLPGVQEEYYITIAKYACMTFWHKSVICYLNNIYKWAKVMLEIHQGPFSTNMCKKWNETNSHSGVIAFLAFQSKWLGKRNRKQDDCGKEYKIYKTIDVKIQC